MEAFTVGMRSYSQAVGNMNRSVCPSTVEKFKNDGIADGNVDTLPFPSFVKWRGPKKGRNSGRARCEENKGGC